MSVNLIKVNNGYNTSNVCEYQIQTEADLDTIKNCSAGSVAYLTDLSKIWMFDGKGNWK